MNIKHLFCTHNNCEEIARYYETDIGPIYMTHEMIYRSASLHIYKVFRCSSCGKKHTKKILKKEYDGCNAMYRAIDEIRDIGYVSYDEFILK
jgi:hypothetical protein